MVIFHFFTKGGKVGENWDKVLYCGYPPAVALSHKNNALTKCVFRLFVFKVRNSKSTFGHEKCPSATSSSIYQHTWLQIQVLNFIDTVFGARF